LLLWTRPAGDIDGLLAGAQLRRAAANTVSATLSAERRFGLFCMFSLFNFSCISREGQPTPLAPMCGRPWIDLLKKIESGRFGGYGVVHEHDIRLLLTH